MQILYIDPSVMTYAIQAIAGIVIALGATIGIIWRKSKKKVSNKLGIDENKNKEVESDEIVIKNEEEKTTEKKENTSKPKKETKKNSKTKKK